MRGRILGYDGRTGEGQISGEDGERYPFTVTEWKQPRPPAQGEAVDFESDAGTARSIYRLSGGGAALAGDKNKIVAALLAFFLGGLGIHKFYLGKNTAGIVMLLCSLFGAILLFVPTIIVGIIAFIEFIIYLVIPEDEFERKYVRGDQSWF